MKFLSSLLGLLLLGSVTVTAQTEAENAMKEAADAYKSKKYAAVQRLLQTAIMEVNNEMTEALQVVFPAPLAGWDDNGINNLQNGGMLGGGIGVEKHFRIEKDDISSTIRISIITGSALITNMTMMINNPMMAANYGKSVKVGSEKGLERFDQANQDGEINLVIDNLALVTISGSGISDKSILTAYAQAIDYKKLRSLIKE